MKQWKIDKQKTLPDKDVWNLLDKEIIGMCEEYLATRWLTPPTDQARATWWSDVYKHYNVSIIHHASMDGGPGYIEFKFTCKHDPVKHKHHTRRRMETSHGTKNLQRGQRECENRRGVTGDSNARAQQTLTSSISTYTPACHHALIGMWCAISCRPFNSVCNPYYIDEVEMLHPGTHVPSPSTISRDINMIYTKGSTYVKQYFAVSAHDAFLLDQWFSVLLFVTETCWCYTSGNRWVDCSLCCLVPWDSHCLVCDGSNTSCLLSCWRNILQANSRSHRKIPCWCDSRLFGALRAEREGMWLSHCHDCQA